MSPSSSTIWTPSIAASRLRASTRARSSSSTATESTSLAFSSSRIRTATRSRCCRRTSAASASVGERRIRQSEEEAIMTASHNAAAEGRFSRRGFLQRSAAGFAAAIAITPAGALLNVSEAWALDVKGLKPETMKTLILVARDIYPHDRIPDAYYAIAMKTYDEKAADPAVKAEIEGFVGALDGAAGPGGYVGQGWEADRV